MTVCLRHSWCREDLVRRIAAHPVLRVLALLTMVALTYPLGVGLAMLLIAVLP